MQPCVLLVSLAAFAYSGAASIIPGVQFKSESVRETNLSTVHFYLHTNQNPVEADELFVGDREALQNSNYRTGGPLWFLVHGFAGNPRGLFPYETGLDLLGTKNNGNVILLDWEVLASGRDYPIGVEDAYAIGNYSAEFIQFLINEKVLTPHSVHMIGFSLGGQIVGIASHTFYLSTGEKFGRITALDPAGPLFEDAPPDNRLSSDDAHFVDVIHSNAGISGMIKPTGHVDFYPNGGIDQTGCNPGPRGARCSHLRASQIFKESITTPTPFCACKCESWEEYDSGNCACTESANLGYYVDQSARDSYYLRTNAESPFAQGQCRANELIQKQDSTQVFR